MSLRGLRSASSLGISRSRFKGREAMRGLHDQRERGIVFMVPPVPVPPQNSHLQAGSAPNRALGMAGEVGAL